MFNGSREAPPDEDDCSYTSTQNRVTPIYKENDILKQPLMNTLESLTFFVSDSIIDPFSALIKHLKQSAEEDHTHFDPLISFLSLRVPHGDILDHLFQLLEESSKPDPVRKKLVLQSMYELSINNPSVCQKLMEKYTVFLGFKVNISEVLSIFQSAAVFASDEVIKDLVKTLPERENDFKSNLEIRGQFFSVYAALSVKPRFLSRSLVEDIIKRTNYQQENTLIESIASPCLICVSNIISYGDSTEAYQVVRENASELVAKIIYALNWASIGHSTPFVILIMRVLIEVNTEFPESRLMEQFSLLLKSTLAVLSMRDDENAKELGEIIEAYCQDS